VREIEINPANSRLSSSRTKLGLNLELPKLIPSGSVTILESSKILGISGFDDVYNVAQIAEGDWLVTRTKRLQNPLLTLV
jgi:hypothetical protein